MFAMIAKVVTSCERQYWMKIEADWLMEAISLMGAFAVRQKGSHHKKLPGADDQRKHIDQHQREQWLVLIGGHDQQQKGHAARQLEQLHRIQIVTEKACIPGNG